MKGKWPEFSSLYITLVNETNGLVSFFSELVISSFQGGHHDD